MPIITKIETQKKNNTRVNVYLDDEFFCGLQQYVCVKFGLKKGLEVTQEYLTKVLIESDYEKAVNKAMTLLGKMLKTKKQLKDYLAKKGYDDIIIDKVMSKLIEYGYIDDKNYVNMYLNTYGNKYGQRKLKYELIKKGVSKSLVDEAFIDYEQNKDVVLKIAKKYIKNKPHFDYATQQKLAQHLAYKGFSWDDIKECIELIKKEG